MKAVSLWQPWASLVALGLKEYETRHWYIAHRGLLAIHAAKKWDADNQVYLPRFKRAYPQDMAAFPETLPLGACLCVVRLTACISSEVALHRISAREAAFGNYAPGRWAWKLELIEVFDEPIPARGQQNLFDWERADSGDGDGRQLRLFNP